jgi:aminoglycoside phosphotransferase (APT) family kinase protein
MAASALRELAPRGPPPRQLIHSDLLYRNVLIQGNVLTAVLDWGNAMYRDGLYDLAWLLYWWRWFPAWPRRTTRSPAAGGSLPTTPGRPLPSRTGA